jgi:enamine deaminase RidA (YjgF/YER057c/UK114 family)
VDDRSGRSKWTIEEVVDEMDEVVSMTTYHVDIADLEGFRAIKDEFIHPPYPAWTAVGVTALAAPEMLIEIAVVAIAGSGLGPATARAPARAVGR